MSFIGPDGKTYPDNELSNVVRKWVRDHCVLKSVSSVSSRPGGLSTKELEDRIVGAVVEQYSLDWNRGIPPEELIGYVDVSQVVSQISPLSSCRKDIAPVIPVEDMKSWSTWSSRGFSTNAEMVNVSKFPTDKILELIQFGVQGISNLEKQKLAASLLQQKMKGEPVQVPVEVVDNAKQHGWTWPLLAGGTLVFIGGLALAFWLLRK